MAVVERPLTARSVLASTLLGTDPPRLPASFLVKTGELFGLSEGSIRTALSRMASAGEVLRDERGYYELQGDLVARQARQRTSRQAATSEWNGRWEMFIVRSTNRTAIERSDLRSAMRRLHMAELREGVWLRPNNLDKQRQPEELWVVERQCLRFDSIPKLELGEGEAALVAQLWDLQDWAATAAELRRRMHESAEALRSEEPESLASGFVLSAAVLRHLGSDPLLPRELLQRNWPGARVRADYEAYDQLYRQVLSKWVFDAVPES